MSKLSQKREEIMKELEEHECGIHCNHETAEDHYVIDKDFFSSSFDKLIATVVEMAEEMKINVDHPISYSAMIIHGERAEGLEEGYNFALSSLTKELTEKE